MLLGGGVRWLVLVWVAALLGLVLVKAGLGGGTGGGESGCPRPGGAFLVLMCELQCPWASVAFFLPKGQGTPGSVAFVKSS